MSNPVLYDTHMHTPLCKHAEGEPEQYAEVAAQRRLKGIIFTCHNPMPDGYAFNSRMSVDQIDDYVHMVQDAAAASRPQVDVRLGLECDYYPGVEHWLDQQVNSLELHYVLGSVHPMIKEYQLMFWQGEHEENQRTYFTHLAMAAETGLFDCLSHPDLIKNIAPKQWWPDKIIDHICHCLDRIARCGTAMEFNTSGWNKPMPEPNPGPMILREMAKREIPVVIGSDAHVPERVGDRFDTALDWLGDAGYSHSSYYLDRKRIDVPIEQTGHSLN